jgi:hypothetical protein
MYQHDREPSQLDFQASRVPGPLLRKDVLGKTDKFHLIGYGFAGIDLRFAMSQFPDLASRAITLLTVSAPNK